MPKYTVQKTKEARKAVSQATAEAAAASDAAAAACELAALVENALGVLDISTWAITNANMYAALSGAKKSAELAAKKAAEEAAVVASKVSIAFSAADKVAAMKMVALNNDQVLSASRAAKAATESAANAEKEARLASSVHDAFVHDGVNIPLTDITTDPSAFARVDDYINRITHEANLALGGENFGGDEDAAAAVAAAAVAAAYNQPANADDPLPYESLSVRLEYNGSHQTIPHVIFLLQTLPEVYKSLRHAERNAFVQSLLQLADVAAGPCTVTLAVGLALYAGVLPFPIGQRLPVEVRVRASDVCDWSDAATANIAAFNRLCGDLVVIKLDDYIRKSMLESAPLACGCATVSLAMSHLFPFDKYSATAPLQAAAMIIIRGMRRVFSATSYLIYMDNDFEQSEMVFACGAAAAGLREVVRIEGPRVTSDGKGNEWATPTCLTVFQRTTDVIDPLEQRRWAGTGVRWRQRNEINEVWAVIGGAHGG